MSYQPAKKPVHLVKNLHDVPAGKVQGVLAASEKIDGVYAFLRDGIGYSRTGKAYKSLSHLAQLAKTFMPSHVVVIEWCTHTEDGSLKSVNEISGDQRRDEYYYEATGVVHDAIPMEDFDARRCELPFLARYDHAVHALCGHPAFIENKQTLLWGMEAYERYAQAIIDQGGEGAVFKQPNGIWVAGKKNEVQMKIKQGCSYDLEVTGVEEGKGKYEGTLGKLVCHWTDGRVVKCSGMTDQQRHDWWVFPETIIGWIVKVDGMCLTPDGMVREPRFKEVRLDKDEADV
jgi:DNA ligase-1